MAQDILPINKSQMLRNDRLLDLHPFYRRYSALIISKATTSVGRFNKSYDPNIHGIKKYLIEATILGLSYCAKDMLNIIDTYDREQDILSGQSKVTSIGGAEWSFCDVFDVLNFVDPKRFHIERLKSGDPDLALVGVDEPNCGWFSNDRKLIFDKASNYISMEFEPYLNALSYKKSNHPDENKHNLEGLAVAMKRLLEVNVLC